VVCSHSASRTDICSERFGIELDAVVANRVFPSRFTSEDVVTLAGAPQDPAIESARWFAARARAQPTQLARLRRGLAQARCTTLPFVFKAELEPVDVERFADLLEPAPS
jgi:hypothetical protein